ncbi:MAG TPA: lantibiotic dehydratase [Thermoanaerobaculia bacterium]|nr:lantibiotic dehydratase [Thermoanaerobaculia bacterium]
MKPRNGPPEAERRPANPAKGAAPAVPTLVPSGFFAFRTPLLPFEELEAWSAGLTALSAVDDPAALAAALAADQTLLRTRLQEALERPEIAEALFLASPSLFDGMEVWRKDPDSKKGKRVESALVRYFQRMAARATPFGLFSGCSLGPVATDGDPAAGETAAEAAEPVNTRLDLAPRADYQRHTRLDMDYLFALAEDLGRDPALRRELLYRPNSSLYQAAGRWRYAEARLDGKVRSHHLVALDSSEYLDATLERAARGATAAELAQALVAADPDGEITLEDAEGFLTELIDGQILVSDLQPPVTGPEAIHDLVAQLGGLPSGATAAAELEQARRTLEELDAAGVGASPERYREVARRLEQLPTSVELSRLFQVDMVKPCAVAGLGAELVRELLAGVALLHRLASRSRQEVFERFRQDFSDRYGDGRWVPLTEVLDEEVGIGFEKSGAAGAEASPLLRGIGLAGTPAEPTIPWGTPQALLLRKLTEALGEGRLEITLDAKDLERLASGEPPPLPDAFEVMATLAAESPAALAEGRYRVLLKGAAGPSGAPLLGRFCHADPALHRAVEAHLQEEEALKPDAIFAEVVHLPQGRIGNILSRPVLRRHEIPFLGRSGTLPEHQIPVTDLLVSIVGQRIVLRSRRFGREVIPRLTSAHNFVRGSLGVYRFLCVLQSQGLASGLGWSWGALDSAPFLPRVTTGRLVLSRARWRMTEAEIQALAKPKGADRFTAVQRFRAERRLPRLVYLADADNELLVDLDNVLSIDSWLDVVEERKEAMLIELFPGPGELCARGREGRFVHELILPLVRQPAPESPEAPRREAGRTVPTPIAVIAGIERSFPPGSEWLYAKLYTGSSTADRVIRELLSPVVHEALATGGARGWFFIRYGDPQWHVRVRFQGDPAKLLGQVLPSLATAAAPWLADGRLWKLQLDTYEREVERYGGPEGILLCERLFEIDSAAVLEIVESLEGDEGADARWRLALVGTDLLLSDLGLDGAAKIGVLSRLRESFLREFGGGKDLRIQLDQKFRTERKSLDALLDLRQAEDSPLAPGIAALRRRSALSAPALAELQRLEAAGQLAVPLADLSWSLVHMHVNRMIRSAARAHELVLYDLLGRLHESQAARTRGKGTGVPPASPEPIPAPAG